MTSFKVWEDGLSNGKPINRVILGSHAKNSTFSSKPRARPTQHSLLLAPGKKLGKSA